MSPWYRDIVYGSSESAIR